MTDETNQDMAQKTRHRNNKIRLYTRLVRTQRLEAIRAKRRLKADEDRLAELLCPHEVGDVLSVDEILGEKDGSFVDTRFKILEIFRPNDARPDETQYDYGIKVDMIDDDDKPTMTTMFLMKSPYLKLVRSDV